MKIKVTIPNLSKQLLGLEIVKHIRKRTQEGRDKDGKPFKPYSTRYFAMPSGATTQAALKRLESAGNLFWYKKGKSEWVVIKGGYKALKAAWKPQFGGTVNLTLTGQMMKDLSVIALPKDGIQIGFNREENAEKALWNIDRGRDFLGMEDKELERLAAKYLNDNIKVEIV